MILLYPIREFVYFLFSFDLFLLSFADKRMVEEVRPAQPCVGVLVEQPLEKVLKVTLEGFWVSDWIFADMLNKGEQIGSTEGGRAGGEFIENNSQAPKVSSMRIGLFLHNFGCHVQRGPFQRGKHFSFIAHVAGESEVAQLDISLRSH